MRDGDLYDRALVALSIESVYGVLRPTTEPYRPSSHLP